MKKQVLVLLVIVIILSTTIQAALPYKETLETNNYKINSVQCSNNKLRVLVESKAEVNLKILFKVYSSKGSINIFSDKLLKRLSADWFDIDTNLACSDLLRLEVNGYAPIENNQNVVYMNTELSYQFTGNKAQILHNIANTTNTIISVPTSPESIMPVYPYFSYVYFNGRLIQSINENNEETYYAQDQIGSNTMLTDYNGNIIAKNEYDPFGRDVSSNKGEFKFTGKEQDSSGLYYYGARYYDNSIGRFTQIDPEFKAIESGYAYADNNPLIKNDPTGKYTDTVKQIQDAKMSIDYLKNNKHVYELIVKFSQKVGIEPETFTAIGMKEGLNEITSGRWTGTLYAGSVPMGADSFFDEIPSLKKGGYLRSNYRGDDIDYKLMEDSLFTDEKGCAHLHGYFADLTRYLEGVSALIASRRDFFLRTAQDLNMDVSQLSPSERDAWIYLFYNTNKQAKQFLKEGGFSIKNRPLALSVERYSRYTRESGLFAADNLKNSEVYNQALKEAQNPVIPERR